MLGEQGLCVNSADPGSPGCCLSTAHSGAGRALPNVCQRTFNRHLNVGGKIPAKPVPGVSRRLGGAGEAGWGIAEQLPLTGVRPRRGPEVRFQVHSVRLSSTLAWDPLACFFRGSPSFCLPPHTHLARSPRPPLQSCDRQGNLVLDRR